MSRAAMKVAARRHPVATALGFLAISLVLQVLVGAAVRVTVPSPPPLLAGWITIVVHSLWALGALWWLGWAQTAGFNHPAAWRNLRLLWLPALLALVDLGPLTGVRGAGLPVIASAALYALLTGFNEEAQFRGVILQALLPVGALRAALISAGLFGLVHLNNLLLGGGVALAVFQVSGAALLGVGYAAVRLRTNTIWPLIAIHGLTDFATDLLGLVHSGQNIASNAGQFPIAVLALALLLPGLLLALYGLFLLRRRPVLSAAAGEG